MKDESDWNTVLFKDSISVFFIVNWGPSYFHVKTVSFLSYEPAVELISLSLPESSIEMTGDSLRRWKGGFTLYEDFKYRLIKFPSGFSKLPPKPLLVLSH